MMLLPTWVGKYPQASTQTQKAPRTPQMYLFHQVLIFKMILHLFDCSFNIYFTYILLASSTKQNDKK